MSSFLALYRGNSIAQAKLVAVSADPTVVCAFAQQLLHDTNEDSPAPDPVLASIEHGRRRALRLIVREHDAPALAEVRL